MRLPTASFTCQRRTKPWRRICVVVVVVVILCYLGFPYLVDKYALPLFCDETAPCQNHAVQLYSHDLASHRVVSCHFDGGHDHAIAILGELLFLSNKGNMRLL